MDYYTYILRCGDGSLYTGITTDLLRRFSEHSGGGKRGAKYTASHRPVRYEAAWRTPGRAQALQLERRIKALTRSQKEALLGGRRPDGFDVLSCERIYITDKGERAMLLVCYPKCATCRRARQYLDERGISYTVRDIKQDNPTEAELREWHKKSGLPFKRFFNISGQQYRALLLREQLTAIPEEERFALLATDGMLVRRPILVGDDFVLVGFRLAEWNAKL